MRPLAPFAAAATALLLTASLAEALPRVDDFDGDGKADLAVFEPSPANWRIRKSSTGAVTVTSWGWNEVTPAPGDYDGDGKTDIAVYHQPTGMWYILQSSNNTMRQQGFGWADATAVPGDYDGDGKTDIAVYHQAGGIWYILQSSTGTMRQQSWGWADAAPAPADYDGDGKTDITVYYPATGNWYILQSKTATQRQVAWGFSDAAPVPADYDGDGKADIAVYHQAAGNWHVLPSNGAASYVQNWGWNQTVAVPGDYDGDGKADITVYHRATATWSVITSDPSPSWFPVHGNRFSMPVGLPYQIFRQKLARLPKRVVVFGDSVAAGAGATGYSVATTYPPGQGAFGVPNRAWSYQLVQNDDAAWPEHTGQDIQTKVLSQIPANAVNYHNFSFGGATTSTAITYQLSANSLAKQQFPTPPSGTTLVVLDIGGNDLLSSQSSGAGWYQSAVSGATTNLGTIVTKIRQIFGAGTPIYVAGVYDPTDSLLYPPAVLQFDATGWKDGTTSVPPLLASQVFAPGVPFSGASVALNSSYSAVAGALGITTIDIRVPFLHHGHWWSAAGQSGHGWFADWVHPNDTGHSALRDAYWASVDQAFSTL